LALFESTFPPYHPFGSRNLTVGDHGTDVAIVQAVYDLMIATMNPPQGPMGAPITVDGDFGPNTRTAVRNIQSYFGIGVDGVVGPNTYFLFGQGVGSHTTYGGPAYGSRELQQGDQGGDVTILQNRLNCFRYSAIIGHPGNGVFDAATAHAVLALKSDAANNGDTGFPHNPIAGDGLYDATWLYTFAGGRALQTGRNGFDVVFVQVLLAQLGYYSGRYTGYYDAATRAAVIAFQHARGIAADGVVGPMTFYQLGLGNQEPAPQPLAIAWPAAQPTVPPTTPPGEVTVCSVALVTQSSDLHPYGEASHVVNGLEGFESLDVVGNMLPDPSTFGSEYGQYAFTLTDPATGSVIENVLMAPTPDATSDWAGSFSPGVKTIPEGVVTVYPTPAGSATGPYGPAVLAGNLAHCH
jgi:peptidoglycan hydrolase-like protein with peptidoglycan-binding domain